MKRVLAIGAHFDDIEWGLGGTLIKHKEAGDFTVYLCMTNTESVDGITGEVLRSKKDVYRESSAAASIMGVDAIHRLSFTDLKVPFSFESVSAVEKIIRQYDIDWVYTHWAGDANQDHIATFKATMASARYVPNVLCYEQVPIPRLYENHMNINYYVDITDQFAGKLQASFCHDSQVRKYEKHGFDVGLNLTRLAEYNGIQAGCKFAEGFKAIKLVN